MGNAEGFFFLSRLCPVGRKAVNQLSCLLNKGWGFFIPRSSISNPLPGHRQLLVQRHLVQQELSASIVLPQNI